MKTKQATTKKTASRLAAVVPELLAVLEEFVRAVDAVGADNLLKQDTISADSASWPDLDVTYRKAVRAIKRARASRA